MTSIIIAGAGPSIHSYEWSDRSIPVMAVSSGIIHVPDAQHFVSLDRPANFNKWVTDSDRFVKHVANNKFADWWRQYPNVRVWDYEDGQNPRFIEGPIMAGPLPCNYSLLAAVQIAPRLGFDKLIFIGCDLLENELAPVAGVLQKWHAYARGCGVEWVNASPLSIMRDWMPEAQEMAVI